MCVSHDPHNSKWGHRPTELCGLVGQRVLRRVPQQVEFPQARYRPLLALGQGRIGCSWLALHLRDLHTYSRCSMIDGGPVVWPMIDHSLRGAFLSDHLRVARAWGWRCRGIGFRRWFDRSILVLAAGRFACISHTDRRQVLTFCCVNMQEPTSKLCSWQRHVVWWFLALTALSN